MTDTTMNVGFGAAEQKGAPSPTQKRRNRYPELRLCLEFGFYDITPAIAKAFVELARKIAKSMRSENDACWTGAYCLLQDDAGVGRTTIHNMLKWAQKTKCIELIPAPIKYSSEGKCEGQEPSTFKANNGLMMQFLHRLMNTAELNGVQKIDQTCFSNNHIDNTTESNQNTKNPTNPTFQTDEKQTEEDKRNEAFASCFDAYAAVMQSENNTSAQQVVPEGTKQKEARQGRCMSDLDSTYLPCVSDERLALIRLGVQSITSPALHQKSNLKELIDAAYKAASFDINVNSYYYMVKQDPARAALAAINTIIKWKTHSIKQIPKPGKYWASTVYTKWDNKTSWKKIQDVIENHIGYKLKHEAKLKAADELLQTTMKNNDMARIAASAKQTNLVKAVHQKTIEREETLAPALAWYSTLSEEDQCQLVPRLIGCGLETSISVAYNRWLKEQTY